MGDREEQIPGPFQPDEGAELRTSFIPVPDAPSQPPPPPDAVTSAAQPPVSPPGHEARLAQLEAKLGVLETHGARRPWFREVSSLVAVLALAFSFGTTFVSLNRTAQQDENDKKAQLLSLIDQLSTLSRDFAADQTAYANNPAVLSALSAVLTQDQLLAAEQAASIMAQIPADVGSAEYTFVANVLVSNGLDEVGRPLYQRAISAASNANDLVGALRSEGLRDFVTGRVDEARMLFGQALEVFKTFKSDSASYVTYTQLQTELGWTQGELFVRSCDEAKAHLAAAQGYAVGISATDSRVQELQQLVPLVAACVPGPPPSPGALPSLPLPN